MKIILYGLTANQTWTPATLAGALPLSYPSRTSLSKVHVQEVPIITAAIHGGLGNTKSTLPPLSNGGS